MPYQNRAKEVLTADSVKIHTRRLVLLSLFLALGIVLYVVETLFLPPFPLPGAKLGLTNVVTLVLLIFYSWRECLYNVLARTILGSLIVGTFLTPAFYLSFGGALMSTFIMIFIFNRFYGKFSLVGVSLTGSTTHNMVQLTLAGALIAHHWGILFQAPFLILIAIPTGAFNGIIATYLVKRLPLKTSIL